LAQGFVVSDVYLVDDHALVRDGLRAVLEAAGHRVSGESAQPLQALARIQALAPQIVLLDLNLGQHSGFELLSALQHDNVDAKTISVTMSAQPRHVTQALRLGAAGYILKGSPAVELLQAIGAVLQGRRFLGQDVAELVVQDHTPFDDDDAMLFSLSARERQILILVSRGSSSAAIGLQLHLSPKTVDSYRSRLMTKIGASDVPALVRFAIRAALVSVDER
jgi:two-component system, NarL family, invasion response regulator UvrY